MADRSELLRQVFGEAIDEGEKLYKRYGAPLVNRVLSALGTDVDHKVAKRAVEQQAKVEGIKPRTVPATAKTPPAKPRAVTRPDDKFRGEGTPQITVVKPKKPFVVRSTTQSQIDDMIASGLVRPKEGGYGKQQSPQIYFGESDVALPTDVFSRPQPGKFVLVGKSENLAGREGPISLDDLEHIWEDVDGEIVDILPDVLRKNQDFTPTRDQISTSNPFAAKTPVSSLSVKTVQPERGRTAYGTYELAPGVMTRHRQDVLKDEALRDQFSLDPSTSWQTPEGTDTLYDVLEMPQSPTVRMTGIYKPDVPGAVEESNIGFAARPRLDIGPDGNPLPDQYNAMSGAEAVRAVADTQGAGAWSMPILPNDLEQAGALFMPTRSPTDIQRLLELRERGAKYGLPDIGDLGEGVMLTNFEKLPLGSDTKRAISGGNLGRDIRRILGSSTRPEQIGTTGGYIGLEDAWMQPEGSGAVSEALRGYLDQMAPRSREAMLEDPRVAQAFGQRFLRDEQARMVGVPVRDDVQRAREAIAEQERLQALFDLIARGRPAMAQGGLVAAGG